MVLRSLENLELLGNFSENNLIFPISIAFEILETFEVLETFENRIMLLTLINFETLGLNTKFYVAKIGNIG